MKLINVDVSWNQGDQEIVSFIEAEIQKLGTPLRWYIIKSKQEGGKVFATIEAVIDESNTSVKLNVATNESDNNRVNNSEPVIVHIVPTGIGAAIGGSLGDAMPVNLFLSKIGTLVTHPNSCNGGPLLLADQKSFLYVEGYSLDEWMKGSLNIQVAQNQQKVGVVLDSGADTWTTDRAINAINGFYAHTGANIVGIQKTQHAVLPSVFKTETGVFTGKVENMETIFDAVEKLIEKGANRIAIFTHVKVSNDDWTEYFKGKIPNPVGGVEALMSHLVSKKYGIISAHGPLVSQDEESFIQSVGQVAPEAALEAASPFYLWCVLRGLQESPNIVNSSDSDNLTISSKEVSVVICPASALGGVAVLRANELGKPILAVKNNTSVLHVTNETLGLQNVIEVESFVHVAGILTKAKASNDFSTENLRLLSTENSIYESGMQFIKEQGINPDSVIRPSTFIKIYE